MALEVTEQILAASEYFLYPHSGMGIVIFGRALTQAEIEHYGDSWEATDYKQNGGYIFGDWASVACIEGELGSNHLTRCIKISREQYEQAHAENWDVNVVMVHERGN